MTSLRLVVSEKLPHAVKSYKARAGGGSQAGSQAATKEPRTEAGSGAGDKELQLGAEPRTQNLGAKPLFWLPTHANY